MACSLQRISSERYNCTRLEIIDYRPTTPDKYKGRVVVIPTNQVNQIKVSVQDGNRTLKIFLLE